MKNRVISILKVILRVLRAVLYALSGGRHRSCGCEKNEDIGSEEQLHSEGCGCQLENGVETAKEAKSESETI